MHTENINDKFFQLLRYSLDESAPVPNEIEKDDWAELLRMAQKQAVVGLLFEGIKRLPKNYASDADVIMQWFVMAQTIAKRNKMLNDACIAVQSFFWKKGFECCLLKGQGNALMYPDKMERTPGDIDLWVVGKPVDKDQTDAREEDIRRIVEMAKRHKPDAKPIYYHVDYADYKGVPVELHYRPSFLHRFKYNKRLQEYFFKNAPEQMNNWVQIDEEKQIVVPTWSFNVVYQLAHVYRHIMEDGIGLRQIVDYYYLLQTGKSNRSAEMEKLLRHLGLFDAAGALMWLLREKLHLCDELLICEPNEWRGRQLLKDMLEGGNFGQYDAKGNRKPEKSAIIKNLIKLKRDFKMMGMYPSESLSEPLFRLWHARWRWVRRRFL